MKKTIIIIFLSFFTFLSSVDASGSLSVNSSVKQVGPNGQFSITMSGSCIGRLNIQVSNGRASESAVWIEENSKKISITAGSSGTVVVTISPVEGFSDPDGNIYNPGVKKISIPIVADSTTSKTTTTTGNKVTTKSTKTTKKETEVTTKKEEIVSSTSTNNNNLIYNDMEVVINFPIDESIISSKYEYKDVEIGGTSYKTLFFGNSQVLLFAKSSGTNGYYIYDIPSKKITEEIVPITVGNNIYYFLKKLDSIDKYESVDIQISDYKINSYKLNDNYYIIKSIGPTGDLVMYLYESTEGTIQLYNEDLFNKVECNYICKSSKNFIVVIGIIFGFISLMLFLYVKFWRK